jgi:hypothetical protein
MEGDSGLRSIDVTANKPVSSRPDGLHIWLAGPLLKEARVVALERAKTEKEAHGEFDSEHPGYCGQQTFIDTYTKVALVVR